MGDDNFNEEITVGSTIEYIKLKTPKRIVVPNHKDLAFPSGESQKVSVKPVLLIKEGDRGLYYILDVNNKGFGD